MAPQVVQYPRATSLTAHSSRAAGVEVAAWAASLIAAPVGGGGAWPGFETAHHHAAPQAPLVWRVPEGPEGTRGPGCGTGGRWRGLAGLRDDAPSEARGADGSRAGRRPRAHRAARPHSRIRRRPEHQRRNTPHRHNKTAQPHRGRAAQTIRERVSAGSRRCPDHRDRFPDGRSKCQA